MVKQYSVTLMNSTTIENGNFLHTWLKLEGPVDPPEFFSFGSPTTSCAVTGNCRGVSNVDQKLIMRKPTQVKRFDLSLSQFHNMLKSAKNMVSESNLYTLLPVKDNKFNCVKAAAAVLATGGVDFLNDVITLLAVANKINGLPFYDRIDFFVYGSFFLILMCVIIFIVILLCKIVKKIISKRSTQDGS